jgi:hypothetical protein
MNKIPEQEILAMFGGLMACSPLIYRNMLLRLGKNYGLSLTEVEHQVTEVLNKTRLEFNERD